MGSGGPRPGRAPARGYSGPGRFPLRTLTSGLRPEGWKNPEYLQGHMVTGEPVNISGWSHGLCVTGELDSGPGRTSSGRSHGLYVMEELGLMCDGGDC